MNVSQIFSQTFLLSDQIARTTIAGGCVFVLSITTRLCVGDFSPRVRQGCGMRNAVMGRTTITTLPPAVRNKPAQKTLPAGAGRVLKGDVSCARGLGAAGD